MPKFGAASLSRLETCDPQIQGILNEAIKHVDFSVLCGHRGEAEQDEAFRTKKSTKRWPDSKHNRFPSMAVDIAPWPVDWDDLARFARLAGYVERVADERVVRIRWGGDWNDNFRTNDERFVDMPHIELVEDRWTQLQPFSLAYPV